MLGASCILAVVLGRVCRADGVTVPQPASAWQAAAGAQLPCGDCSGRWLVRRANHQESLNLCELRFNIFMLIQIDFSLSDTFTEINVYSGRFVPLSLSF